MSLKFILGAAGSGKTEWMYRQILETAAKDPQKTVLVVVPEQFSLRTMQDLIERSETKSMSNIEVLSFLRLSYRVFEELGVTTGPLLSDLGKSLILKRVLNQNADRLRLFAANMKKAGFLDELKSLISEFYQYGITPESILEIAGEPDTDPVLQKKLSDIAILFEAFGKAIEGKFLPTETVSDVLAGVLDQSEFLRGCTAFFDGFTGFTPSQYGLLRKLFAGATECYMALTIDPAIGKAQVQEHGLFYFTAHTREVVRALAEEAGCATEELYLAEGEKLPRFVDSEPIAALERGLFRYPLPRPVSCGEDVLFVERKDRKDEVAFIAADIARRVRTQGGRYGRIAVISGDVEAYGEAFTEELTAAGIPYFLDCKRNVFHNPCITLIRAILQNAQTPYSFDSVFRYLKSSLTDYSEAEVSELENYCLACGIRGESGWKREWKYKYRTKRTLPIAQLNDLRERVYTELKGISEALRKEPTAGAKTRALYAFLEQIGAEDKLNHAVTRFEAQGDEVRAGEYRQVYRSVIDLFDRFVELMDEEEVSMKEYTELCETGFRECKIGLIPTGGDYVLIGDLMRSRLSDIDVLYLAGVNEGVTPKPVSGGGLISEVEREELKARNRMLAPGRKEAAYTEQFYLYSVLTKPKRKLIMTCSRISSDGGILAPSWFVRRISELYTDFTVQQETGTIEAVLGNDYGRRALLNGLRRYAGGEEVEPEVWELYRQAVLADDGEVRRLLSVAFFGNASERIAPETAQKLYGSILYGSVTRLEKYAACAFAHFAQYGLELEERAEYRAAAPELGNLYHAALELFTRKVADRGLSWHTITEEQREELCSESLEEAVAAVENGVFVGTGRNSYLVVKAKRILLKAVSMLQEQVKGSRFEPEHCEAAFSHTSKFLALHGKIDRYDLCENDGKWYVRVIDYKSGSKDFNLAELYYGLQVQLEVYLAAARRQTKAEHGVEPEVAGMFYFHLGDPFIDREEYSEEAVLSQFRPDGLMNRAPSALTALDQSFAEAGGGLRAGYKSLLIPAETNKAGELKATSKTADGAVFDSLTEYVYRKLEQEADEIYAGAVESSPYRYNKKTPCGYCVFRSVCGFDARLSEFAYRNLQRMKDEEVLGRIGEALEKGGEN